MLNPTFNLFSAPSTPEGNMGLFSCYAALCFSLSTTFYWKQLPVAAGNGVEESGEREPNQSM